MADIEGASIAPDVRPAEPAPAAAQMADVVEPVAPDVRASEPAAAAAQIADVAGPDARDSQPAPAVARASVLAGSQKRKRAADQTKSLEEVTAAIKACHEEADKAEADIRERQATAEAARAKARRLSQEYERKQRVAALARLEASCRKRPKNPYFIFSEEIRPTLGLGAGTGTGGMLKKIAELWANLSDEGKQPYKDKFELATQEYAAWVASEEGSRVLRERNEVILQCKAASGELAEATAALQPRQQQEDEQATPAKSEQLPALSPNKDVKPDPKEKRADGSKAPKRDPRQLGPAIDEERIRSICHAEQRPAIVKARKGTFIVSKSQVVLVEVNAAKAGSMERAQDIATRLAEAVNNEDLGPMDKTELGKRRNALYQTTN